MILSVLFAATMMLADAAPAAAATATPAQPAAAAPAKKTVEDKLVCKTEAVTGSLFPKKTCRLQSEFARQQEEQRRELQKMQREIPRSGN